MRLRITCLSLTTLVFLTLAVVPTMADITMLYSNGPVNGYTNSWDITTYTVSNEFQIGGTTCPAPPCVPTSAQFSVWMFPGENLMTVDWSVTSLPLGGGMTYGAGIQNTVTTFQFNNGAYDIDLVMISLNTQPLSAGTYYLNLQNAVSSGGDIVGWDENSGAGCTGDGNPGSCGDLTAYTSKLGVTNPIHSEDPDIFGYSIGGSTPEPSSMVLFGSGALAVTTVVRRKLKL